MKADLGYRLLYKYAQFGFRLFYNFRIRGIENVPDNKPLIFAANHQNALMDALAILFAANRPVNFLARADIFKNSTIARILKFLKLMPVFRPRDSVDIVDKNTEVFGKVADMLSKGESIGIMPEGTHTHIKHLQTLKKGICRMAFDAAAVTDFTLDALIVPVGLDYSDYHKQGSRLLVTFGKPIQVKDYYDLYKEKPNKAVTQLRNNLAESISSLMIDVRHPDEYNFIIRYAGWMAADELHNSSTDPFRHFDKVKQEVDYLNGLKTSDPLKFEALKDQYAFLINDPAELISPIKPPYKTGLLKLILSSLITNLGYLLNCVPFLLSDYMSGKVKDAQFVSSIKYGTGILFFPLWYLVVFVITSLVGTPLYALALILLMAITAIYALKHPK